MRVEPLTSGSSPSIDTFMHAVCGAACDLGVDVLPIARSSYAIGRTAEAHVEVIGTPGARLTLGWSILEDEDPRGDDGFHRVLRVEVVSPRGSFWIEPVRAWVDGWLSATSEDALNGLEITLRDDIDGVVDDTLLAWLTLAGFGPRGGVTDPAYDAIVTSLGHGLSHLAKDERGAVACRHVGRALGLVLRVRRKARRSRVLLARAHAAMMDATPAYACLPAPLVASIDAALAPAIAAIEAALHATPTDEADGRLRPTRSNLARARAAVGDATGATAWAALVRAGVLPASWDTDPLRRFLGEELETCRECNGTGVLESSLFGANQICEACREGKRFARNVALLQPQSANDCALFASDVEGMTRAEEAARALARAIRPDGAAPVAIVWQLLDRHPFVIDVAPFEATGEAARDALRELHATGYGLGGIDAARIALCAPRESFE